MNVVTSSFLKFNSDRKSVQFNVMNNVGGALAVLPLQELPKETFSSKFNCIKFKFMKWYPSLLAINNFTGSEKF